MVASGAWEDKAKHDGVSIPFIAGQWSLRDFDQVMEQVNAHVSIPFIAGQWSLRGAARGEGRRRPRVSIPFIAGQWSLPADEEARVQIRNERFNPLHCGAVVASGRAVAPARPAGVSIPFIAGQWSLHPE